jgi:hypothetical protein
MKTPSLGDLFNQQAGTSVGARWAKRPQTGVGGSFGLLPQSSLALVYSDLQGMSVCTGSDRNNSLNQGFVGSTALAVHRVCCHHYG